MENRLALLTDIERIMEIIGEAQCYLKQSGVDQWQNGYPSREVCETDIRNSSCYVFLVEGKIAGLISIIFETETSYCFIEDGKWLSKDDSYAVFHRAAVSNDYRGMGIASQMISFAENIAFNRGYKSLRGDTHRNNKAMRGLLEKHGFIHCGTIFLNSERTTQNERVCYEKLL